MNETIEQSSERPLLNGWARVVVWVVAIAALMATFAAYDQIALALQWVVLKLC